MEVIMLSRIVSGGALPAIAGAAMRPAPSGPAAAFTLSSPSLEQPVAAAGVEQVWWDRWGRWHPNWGGHRWGYHPWGYHPWGWGYRRWGYHPWGYHPWGWGPYAY